MRDRCTLVGGDFFLELPSGGDAYVLTSIIHNWPDEQALAILHTCHRAMRPGARIWLIEHVFTAVGGDAYASLLDLLMLILYGAQERMGTEYQALLEVVGFTEVTLVPGEGTWGIVEAVRP